MQTGKGFVALCGVLAAVVALAAAAPAGAGEEPAWPLLRHTNYVLWEGETGQPAEARMRCIAHGYTRYADELHARAIGPKGEEIDAEVVAPGQEMGFRVTPAATGKHLFQLRAGWNLAVLDLGDRPHAYVASEQAPLQTVRAVERLYFYVPAGTKQFAITASASVTREALLLRVLDPEGGVALEREGDFDKPETLRIPVAAEQAGRVWSLSLLPPKTPGLVIDDVMLFLRAPLPPYLAKRPEWAERLSRK